MYLYSGNGNKVYVAGEGDAVAAINFDATVKSINHRGYSTEAPENTLPAYMLSKKKGFTYVEADISFTSDGVAVLLHDGSINRTARNADGSELSATINISDIAYADLAAYDFGIWKGSAYAGTKIPTFEEFIVLCRNIGLHPYIELKNNGGYTQDIINGLVSTVAKCGMKGKVTWISFNSGFLSNVATADPTARLGYLCQGGGESVVTTAAFLKNETNEVFLDCGNVTDYQATAELCIANGMALEVWTINSADTIKALHPYVTGVTSDNLIAGKVLYEAGMA